MRDPGNEVERHVVLEGAIHSVFNIRGPLYNQSAETSIPIAETTRETSVRSFSRGFYNVTPRISHSHFP